MENHNDDNKNLLIINQTSYLSKFSENRRLRGFSFVPNLSKISSEFSFSKNINTQIHKYTNTQIHKYNKYFQSKKNIIGLCFYFTSYLENATLFFLRSMRKLPRCNRVLFGEVALEQRIIFD